MSLKILLLTAGLSLAGSALRPAQQEAISTLPVFAVASIHVNKSGTTQFRLAFTADGVRLENGTALMIVRAAYGMFNSLDDKFPGTPAWARSERYDLEAKVDPLDAAAFRKLDFEHRQQMVQALLTDRFRLQAHREKREQPVYFLEVTRNGPRIKPSPPDPDADQKQDKGISLERTRGRIVAHGVVLAQLVSALTQTLGRTVEDRSGLTGKFDFTLEWVPEEEDGSAPSAGPSLFIALQEQLGLKLNATRAPVDCLVIDRLEHPSEN